MSLAFRFWLLLAVFSLSIITNALVSIWSIHYFLQQASERFERLTITVPETKNISKDMSELVYNLENAISLEREVRNYRFRLLHEKIKQRVEKILNNEENITEETSTNLLALSKQLSDYSESCNSLIEENKKEQASSILNNEIKQKTVDPFQVELDLLSSRLDLAVNDASKDIISKGYIINVILIVNAFIAILLAMCGIQLARHWVLKPVGTLKTAAEQHAKGNLEYRIENKSQDELGTLANEINRMADSLIEIQKQLVERERMAAIGEVASSIAHNIRNPLASIRASAQSSMNESEQSEHNETQLSIVETVDSLNRWLRELLMVTGQMELNCQQVNTKLLVEGVCKISETYALKKKISFSVHESPEDVTMYVDSSRIEQALLAMIDNAVDASPNGESVRIDIFSNNKEWVEIRVTDKGEGVSEEVINKITSPYFSTKPGGTGIGLHLAKRTAHAHGGKLDFNSVEQQGTVVSITLPCDKEIYETFSKRQSDSGSSVDNTQVENKHTDRKEINHG